MDFEAERLLDGLDPDERVARQRFLDHLAAEGFTLEQLQAAAAENRLALLPVERVLGGTLTAQETADRAGLPVDTVRRMRRLLGLPAAEPDETVFSDLDLEAARATKGFMDAGFDEDVIFEITRVLGEGMARLSATVVAGFTKTFLSAGESEEDVAERFAALAEQLTPALTPVLVAAFRGHLRDSVGRGVLGRDELASGDVAGSQELTVCFADLVGFTKLGVEVEPMELGTVAGRFAQLATSVTAEPVRLVKTIGDAAMFVSPEPGRLVTVALDLVEAVADAELPALRAGIAFGPALHHAGDYYGNTVNLASRVTGAARPGSVLCTKEVREAAGDEGLEWSSAGRHRLKGVSAPLTLYRARSAHRGNESDQKSSSDSAAGDERETASPKRRAGRSRRRASS